MRTRRSLGRTRQTNRSHPRPHPRPHPPPLWQRQGFTLVHFSARLEHCLSLKLPNVSHEVLTSSRKVDECKPLLPGAPPTPIPIHTPQCSGAGRPRRSGTPKGEPQSWQVSAAGGGPGVVGPGYCPPRHPQANTARHLIDTHSNPGSRSSWQPMTWRAIYARPYGVGALAGLRGAVQVESIRPMLKAPGSERRKVQYD